MTPALPLEFNIPGIAVSLQGSSASREAWKKKIQAVVRSQLPGGSWALDAPVEVTIFFLSGDAMNGDIDNRIKPILDALSGPVYIDDRLVDRLVVQRFAPSDACRILNPSRALISAIGSGEPIVYIRIDDDPGREREL